MSRATGPLRLFFGRTPLCACGDVLDAEDLEARGLEQRRIAVSRPEPGPLTNTSTFWRPCSIPLRAALSAVTWAANGVDLREPLNPAEPADSHAIVPLLVGQGDDRVVERGLDVRLADRDVLLDPAAGAAQVADLRGGAISGRLASRSWSQAAKRKHR